MWEGGARIYGIPGVHNNFPPSTPHSTNKPYDLQSQEPIK